MHIQANVVRWRVRVWQRRHRVCRRFQRGQVEVRTDRESSQQHVAAQQQIGFRPLQAKLGVGHRAHPLRVADADVFAGRGQIAIQALLIGDESAQLQSAATGNGGQFLHRKPVLIEDQRPIDLAEAVRQVAQRNGDVGESHLPGEVGLVDGAGRTHGEIHVPGRADVGVETLCKPQVDRSLGVESQRPRLSPVSPPTPRPEDWCRLRQCAVDRDGEPRLSVGRSDRPRCGARSPPPRSRIC